MNEEDVRFEFLSDHPQVNDGFSGRGHERSARALANAINKFSNDDRSIGLEGAWGSGKTTVVTIAEKTLEDSHPKKFAFFSFDLWASQSVEFRRALLEEFLSWSKSYLSTNCRQNLEKRVRGKTKLIEIENERQFSFFGYILLSSLFLLPFVVLWLSPFSANLHKSAIDLNEQETLDTKLPMLFQYFYEYGHWVAFGLITMVVLGFLIQTIYFWKTKGSLRKALDGSFSLFARSSEKDTVSQTIRDGDPTKYEFHQIFSEILSLLQRDGRRVVIVFDNIDRLPADLIQETWSNVRSIFSCDGCQDKSHGDVVTAVIPYDRAHVLSAFEDAEAGDGNLSGKNTKDVGSTYILEDIFRKTFSAVISVVPPVSSDVDAFFRLCLDNALPKQFDNGQKYRLFQIFDVFLTEKGTNPTPRQVKSFVNDVGMLWFQWRGAISIEAIGIFVLHRTKLEREPKSLQDPDTISTRYRHFVPTTKLESELAALAYNVEPSVALEVLLERDIVSALYGSDSKRLLKLSNSTGFQQQLDRILMQNCLNWASSSLEDFENALINYSQLTLDPSIEELCNRHFINSIPKMAKIDLLSWEDHKPLFQIVACIPESHLKDHLNAVAKWINESLPEDLTVPLGCAWIRFIGGFIQEVLAIHGMSAVSLVTSTITIPDSPKFYLGVALDCNEVDLNFSEFDSNVKHESTEISTELIAFGIDKPNQFTRVWKQLQYAFKSSEIDQVFANLMEHVKISLLDEDAERREYFNNLMVIAAGNQGELNIKGVVNTSIVDGTLPWHAHKFHENKDWKGLAEAMWLAHLSVKTGNVPPLSTASKQPFGNVRNAHNWFSRYYSDPDSADVVKSLGELIIGFGLVDDWVYTFTLSSKHTLYKDVLIEILGSKNCPPLELNTLVQSYVKIKTEIETDAVAAMVKRVGSKVSTDEIDQISLAEIPPALVRDLAGLKIDSWAHLLHHVDRHLKKISSDEWREALTKDDHNRQLLFARGDQLGGVIPPNHLRAPLAEFVSEVMVKNGELSEEMDGFETFWSALSTSSGRGVSADVLEHIADKPIIPEGLKVAISTFPTLFAELPLVDHPETAVSKVLMPLLGDDPERVLGLVSLKPSDWEICVKKVSGDIRAQFNDYFSGYEGTEEYQFELDKLRKLLKLRKFKKKPISDESDPSAQDTESDSTE